MHRHKHRCTLLTTPALGLAMVLGATLTTAGCDSRLAHIPDDDLQLKMQECTQVTEKSPGYAIACDNYERECLARREQNRFIC